MIDFHKHTQSMTRFLNGIPLHNVGKAVVHVYAVILEKFRDEGYGFPDNSDEFDSVLKILGTRRGKFKIAHSMIQKFETDTGNYDMNLFIFGMKEMSNAFVARKPDKQREIVTFALLDACEIMNSLMNEEIGHEIGYKFVENTITEFLRTHR